MAAGSAGLGCGTWEAGPAASALTACSNVSTLVLSGVSLNNVTS